MRLAATILTGMLALAACSEPAGWIGDDPHVVEGHWLLAETACAMAPGEACTVAVDAAIAGSELDAADVTGATTADWPGAYRDGRGGTILATTGGFVHATAVILDLHGDVRRLVNVLCSGPMTTDDGTLVSPYTCDADRALPDGQRVGHEPWSLGP